MSRRIENNFGDWREFTYFNKNLNVKDNTLYKEWTNINFSYNNDINQAIKEFIDDCGYKEVAMKLDPNDLQVANACNCPGNPSTGSVWIKNKWHNQDCNVFKTPAADRAQLKLELDQMFGSAPAAKNAPRCECGADATYGPGSGMHSATMPCPLYKKV